MADILFRLKSNTHVDPDKDKRGSYKRGDVVAVFETGHYPSSVGSQEGPPGFTWVRISDVTKAQVEKYLQPETGFEMTTYGGLEEVTKRRRKFGLSVADIPAAVRAQLLAGYYETTWQQIRAYVKNKVTGEGE